MGPLNRRVFGPDSALEQAIARVGRGAGAVLGMRAPAAVQELGAQEPFHPRVDRRVDRILVDLSDLPLNELESPLAAPVCNLDQQVIDSRFEVEGQDVIAWIESATHGEVHQQFSVQPQAQSVVRAAAEGDLHGLLHRDGAVHVDHAVLPPVLAFRLLGRSQKFPEGDLAHVGNRLGFGQDLPLQPCSTDSAQLDVRLQSRPTRAQAPQVLLHGLGRIYVPRAARVVEGPDHMPGAPLLSGCR